MVALSSHLNKVTLQSLMVQAFSISARVVARFGAKVGVKFGARVGTRVGARVGARCVAMVVVRFGATL